MPEKMAAADQVLVMAGKTASELTQNARTDSDFPPDATAETAVGMLKMHTFG